MTDGYTAQELTTYLTCPRQYEMEHVTELTGDSRGNRDQFRELLREAICTGLRKGSSSSTDPSDAAVATLDAEWATYADTADLHSSEQEATEKRRAQAAVEAYFDMVGETHLDQIDQAAPFIESSVIGPNITLSASISGQKLNVDVDYIMAENGRLIGVRLTDTMWGSKVPFESKSDVAEKHLNLGEYKPKKVGTVLAARITEAALDQYGGDQIDSGLRYLSVMENTFESDDSCEATIEQRHMKPFLSESRYLIDEAITWMAQNLDKEQYNPKQVFDEQDYWDGSFEKVVEQTCNYCPYAVGCQEAIRREVMFNV